MALYQLWVFMKYFPARYVSRKHPTDNKSHEILGVQQVKPAELAQQMTLDIGNAWGVLHAIIDTCLEQPPGKYLIMKDPNQVTEFSHPHTSPLIRGLMTMTMQV